VAAGHKVSVAGFDVTQAQAARDGVAVIEQNSGPIDILVNNAGLYSFGPIESVTVEEFHRLFNVNVLGVMLTIRAASKAFGERGGSIINIGSNVSSLLGPASVIYAASKCAVDGVTGVMARELAGRKIRVNSINPGPTETEGVRAMMGTMGAMGREMTGKLLESTPLGRLGQPADIGPIAVFLASAGAGWITGETIVASGGMR
jgi:3-oxoacyl-[acyl-carrier protein] reductase